MTDKELEKIYNEGYRAVYWTAMQLLKNEADAEDVVQDTFVALIESYESINDKDKVIPWLKKTAANRCLNRLTRTKTDAVEDEFFEDVEALPEDFLPDSIVESEDARRIIMDIISGSLSEDVRRTLILFYFDEMSTKDIAEALGVPEGTVRSRLNFARNRIKKEVEKYEKENKTKLFGMALPFLSKLFMKEAEQVPFKAMPAKLISLSASSQVSNAGAATKVAASAAKKGTEVMINKVLIGSIAAVVGVGAVVGIAVGVMTKKGDNAPEPVKTDVTVNETSEQTEGGAASETGNTSDETATPVDVNISGEEMRELTEDDLFISIEDVLYNQDQTEQYIYCYVWNGSIKPGDEIKVIGRTYAGGEEVHLTAGSMTDEFRNPITEANKGERLILVITGDSVNKTVNRGKTVVYADSDIRPAAGVKVRVTFEPGFDYRATQSNYECLFGERTAFCSESYRNKTTLIEQDGDDRILYVEFSEDSYAVYPGLSCALRLGGQTVATGEVIAAYIM